jgi:hypothetical protein
MNETPLLTTSFDESTWRKMVKSLMVAVIKVLKGNLLS